jgi:hypothetical protein
MRIVRVTFAWVCLLVLCSCATKPPTSAIIPATELPSEVSMNKNAGRWGLVFVKLRLEGGEEVLFVVDTGASSTLLDKSLEPAGKRLKRISFSTWSAEQEGEVYPAPRIYLGGAPLMISNIVTCDLKKMSCPGGARGVLGMDCLKHYCMQLDFESGKIRFLDPKRVNAAELGSAFPLTLNWNLPFIYRVGFGGGKSTHLLIDTGYDVDGQVENPKGPVAGILHLRECAWGDNSYTNVLVRQGRNRSVVGLRFLARHLVTFDFPKQTMYLKQRSMGPLVDESFEEAMKFLKGMKERGEQPGWSKEDKGSIWGNPDLPKTLDVQKNGDSSVYHYSVSRTSEDASWKLQRAWRTDAGDRTVDEYPVP